MQEHIFDARAGVDELVSDRRLTVWERIAARIAVWGGGGVYPAAWESLRNELKSGKCWRARAMFETLRIHLGDEALAHIPADLRAVLPEWPIGSEWEHDAEPGKVYKLAGYQGRRVDGAEMDLPGAVLVAGGVPTWHRLTDLRTRAWKLTQAAGALPPRRYDLLVIGALFGRVLTIEGIKRETGLEEGSVASSLLRLYEAGTVVARTVDGSPAFALAGERRKEKSGRIETGIVINISAPAVEGADPAKLASAVAEHVERAMRRFGADGVEGPWEMLNDGGVDPDERAPGLTVDGERAADEAEVEGLGRALFDVWRNTASTPHFVVEGREPLRADFAALARKLITGDIAVPRVMPPAAQAADLHRRFEESQRARSSLEGVIRGVRKLVGAVEGEKTVDAVQTELCARDKATGDAQNAAAKWRREHDRLANECAALRKQVVDLQSVLAEIHGRIGALGGAA